MKKRFSLSAVLDAVHVVFWLSIVFFVTVYVTFGILLIPALMSFFAVGKDILYGHYDRTDSIFGRFFSGIKNNIGMMRYFPLVLILALEAVGVTASARIGFMVISYVCIVLMGLILTYIIYLCLCRTHIDEKCDLVTAAMVMIWSLPNMLAVWLVCVLSCVLFGEVFMVVSALAGAAVMLLIQGTASVGILSFKAKHSALDEDEEKLMGKIGNSLKSGTRRE
ncbi:MAG: hypothetical protein J6I96_01840 [Oscillospiraceae bacterium]|nr:hypothetical protein [Oscillospiraceae bacterium]